ncbi:uncharacterized protein [Argopecten irradians]|uniref:uncharacterized protein n=1 Tax=Argopecten irradians TaxID=31199 RepID=UPI0037112AE4
MADSGQIAFRPQGQITCVHHKGKTLELFCEKCRDVACTKCVTTVHKGHDMCDLCDITAVIIDDIREFVEETERSRLPKRQENIQNTTDELQQNSEYFVNLSKETKRQAERMKQEIDIMTAERLSFYQQMKEDNELLLTNYRRELERGDAELQDQLQVCKRLLQNASAITIYDAKDKVKNYGLQQVTKPALQTTSFEPTESIRGYLEKAFCEKETQRQTTSQASPSDSCQIYHSFGKYRPNVMTKQLLLSDTLLSDVKILGHGKLGFVSASVCCHHTTKVACVCFSFPDKTIFNVFDTALTKQNEIRIDKETYRVCYARDTDNIWAADHVNNCIVEIISGSPTVRLYMKDTPKCFSVTMDRHILVGTSGRVTKFSLRGNIIHSSKNVKSEKCPLFHPYRISECPISQNVAILDKKSDDYKSNTRLVVLNKRLQQLYCCSEVPSGLGQYKGTSFRPGDIVFDMFGNIVVAEVTNRCIILLDGEGNFVKIIYTTQYPPKAIAVDSDNILWVVNGYQIKRIQYTKC